MLILHAGFDWSRLLLWGESPVPADSLPRRRGAGKASEPAALPYDPGAESLAAALTDAWPGFPAARASATTRVVWLPSAGGWPVPSSPLVADLPPEGTSTPLLPWDVNVLSIEAESAVDLLCACTGRETLASGVVVGQTLAYWATALRAAAALVARERFLPRLNDSRGAPRACWKPVLTADEAQRQARLARAMPAACRALTVTADQHPVRSAASALAAFCESMVDALVRSRGMAESEAAGEQGRVRAVAPVRRHGARAARRPAFDSLHDQWLYALCTGTGELNAEAKELEKLRQQIDDWQRPVTVSSSAPYRLCFRLEEPAKANGSRAAGAWHLRYLLQACDDPSLLVEAADAWSARGRKARWLSRGGAAPGEYLLAALGQAAALCPPVERSLRAPAPAGQKLDAAGAHAFLTEQSWLLEQAGFGVFLPAWWTRKGTKLRLAARAVLRTPTMRGGGLSLESLVHFDWQLALGGEPLSLAELDMLARLKAPLVRVRGQWVQVNAAEIQAARDFWKAKGTRQASLRDVVRMALGGAEPPGGLGFDGVVADGWIQSFLTSLQERAGFEELSSPAGFHGTLRPYQARGYSWLAFLRRFGLGACLADDMGLGKTIQTLALVQRDWENNGRRPVLLACPMSVVGNWQKEAERFTPDLPVLVHHGQARQKGSAFRRLAERHALVLTSYALLHRDAELFQQVPWAGVVLDEAQNVKNPETKQARAARALRADYRVALTGTPVENHVGDLWSVMEFLNPGFLGNRAEFKRRFFVPIQAGRDADAAERLRRLTGPFILRRLKTDKAVISDLPDKLEMKVFCPLTREQASLYAAVVADASRDLDKAREGIQRKGVVLATLSKLKQVCNHPAQFLGDNSPLPGRSGKLARLTEMLEEVQEAGDRALVFTQFAEMGGLLKRHLEEAFGREILFLHGGSTRKQREAMVGRFQAADGPRVFLLSLKAGGTGLNLTAANHVFHFDRWWNPAVEDQATDRAFRIGQTRNVQVHKFLCLGTLEERIDEMITRKQAVARQVVGAGEAWLTELSNEQLKDLFALRKEALAE